MALKHPSIAPNEPNLAEEFRKAGIAAGDVVEMANFPNWLSSAIHDAVEAPGEPKPAMEGELVEVTAIGERAILGIILEGSTVGEKENLTYGGNVWVRYNGHSTKSTWEHAYSGARVFRKVGRVTPGGYKMLYPDMVNIYSRCQTGMKDI